MNMPFGREKRRAESYQLMKSQNDCPSPEFPLESRANWRVPARVCDVEAAHFGYFDGTAWTPRLRSPTPIMAPAFTKE